MKMHELDGPKLAVAAALGVVGVAVGILSWMSMPEDTSTLVRVLLGIFVVACITPAFAVWFNWRAGLGVSVVVALSVVIGLQLTLKKTDVVRGIVAARQEQIVAPVPAADTLPEELRCEGGAVLQPMMAPGGTRLVLREPDKDGFVFVGRLMGGQRLALNALEAEVEAKVSTCTDDQGRDIHKIYNVIN